MNDPESLHQELKAIAKTETDRIALARQAVRVARWAMLVAYVALLLLSATFERPSDPVIATLLVSVCFGLLGYGFGRFDKWIASRERLFPASKDPATTRVEWYR